MIGEVKSWMLFNLSSIYLLYQYLPLKFKSCVYIFDPLVLKAPKDILGNTSVRARKG